MKRLFFISASLLVGSAAFAQSQRCVTAPVTVTGNQLTLTSSGDKAVNTDKVYIYYAHKHHRKHWQEYPITAITDKYPSKPVMLSTTTEFKAVPETYNVSVTTPQSNVSVCADEATTVTANINVEKVSSFTGNYPNGGDDNVVYKRVSKHQYKMAARKIRKVKKNEWKIARKTNMPVEAKSNRA